MKELKFRAWHKKKKKMSVVTMLQWALKYPAFLDEIALKIDTELQKHFWDRGEHKELSDVEIMQYTGLKDKNGKEIYEGDILETKYNEIEVMKYDDEEAMFGRRFLQGTFSAKDYYGKSEIIGNIYENPIFN